MMACSEHFQGFIEFGLNFRKLLPLTQVRLLLAASNVGELSQTVGISSIYKRNKLVPRLDPFGTPHLLPLPLTKQVCFLFQRFSPLLCILKF